MSPRPQRHFFCSFLRGPGRRRVAPLAVFGKDAAKEHVMTAKLVTRWNAAAAAIICVFAAVAIAQRTQDTEQPQSSETNRDAAIESDQGQSGRASATQSERSSAQREDRSRQPGERYTANFRGETTAAGGANQEVEKFIANCLLAKNQSEVEISQLAAERAENPQVKQFAQQMVKDHQQLIQKLQPLAGTQTGATERTSRTVVGTTDDPNRARAGDTASDAQTPGLDAQASGATTTTRTDVRTTGDSNAAIQQLIQIDRQIVDRQTEAVRNELEQKQGAEFDKAFVGCAIGAHVHMNAALEVIAQQGEGKLSQLAQQAQPKVQEHLDHAKQLKQDLEQGASTGTGNRAARQPSQPQR
jgi:predicted outer membrane protein